MAELGSKTVFYFTAQKAELLSKRRLELSSNEVRQAFARYLALPNSLADLRYRILRPRGGRGYPLPHATTYVIETEPDAQCLVYRLSEVRHY